jgi:hypothetical protein
MTGTQLSWTQKICYIMLCFGESHQSQSGNVEGNGYVGKDVHSSDCSLQQISSAMKPCSHFLIILHIPPFQYKPEGLTPRISVLAGLEDADL